MSKPLEDCSREELIEIIKSLKKQKKFGLVWEDKPEKVADDCKTKLPVVEEVSEKCLNLVPDEPTNLIIEGDNYHALSVLNYTHAGKIDVIYIDPPYNRGKNDLKYNDSYVDAEDPYKHSKWLSFMNKRLRLAKKLLSTTGVIIVNIDEHESCRMLCLLNEIFGEQNNMGEIVWNKQNPKGDSPWNTITVTPVKR
jgi:adenine-specific DNA-methyltransferase